MDEHPPHVRADDGPQEPASAELVELAQRYGVATEFEDWHGVRRQVAASTVSRVLEAFGTPATGPEQVRASLQASVDEAWRRRLPAVLVARSGQPLWFGVHVPHGDPCAVAVELEDGGRRPLEQQDRPIVPRHVDGTLLGEATFALPPDLPLGWHEVHLDTPSGAASCPLVVTPDRLAPPAGPADRQRWGFMAQLYSVRSQASWGMGDLADLAELVDWSARDLGADFLLVNPLHAAEPAGHMEASPYLPTTRRFVNPVYVRVEDVREVAYLTPEQRARIEAAAAGLRPQNASTAEIDRDAVWTAKKDALGLVFAAPRSAARQAAFDAFCEREGVGLAGFATWCAIAEHLGMPPSTWPDEVHDPTSARVGELRVALAERITFFQWLQWVADEQLARAQQAAVDAGMAFGIVHDLAVGVHPEGADTWALSGALAQGVSVGAPPDAFNQQGQDWSQPPWRPQRLAELGYAPYRDMLRTVLRHSGGIRVDHVMGLFRLWCIPQGAGPDQGTYVRYDHEALLGILCLEAQRAGAFVVGEDLGVVEPWVREILRERGVLGTSILWFERDSQGRPLPPEAWRELCLATVTTHDLPPTAGYLAGEHVELRHRLGLLTRDLEEELEVDAADRATVLELLRSRSLLPDGATEQQTVEALHRLLTWTPCRLLGVSLPDATGDHRTQNQPGTSTQYPNWKVPLGDGSGEAVLLEDLRTDPRVLSLAQAVSASR